MKYLFQFIIIIVCSFMGEIMNYFIPLPVPASVYGMLILFAGLMFKIIKLENVEQTADFMLLIMPVFFISPSVSLISSYETMKGQFVAFVLIAIVSTVTVMVVTAWIAQKIIKSQKQGRMNNE